MDQLYYYLLSFTVGTLATAIIYRNKLTQFNLNNTFLREELQRETERNRILQQNLEHTMKALEDTKLTADKEIERQMQNEDEKVLELMEEIDKLELEATKKVILGAGI